MTPSVCPSSPLSSPHPHAQVTYHVTSKLYYRRLTDRPFSLPRAVKTITYATRLTQPSQARDHVLLELQSLFVETCFRSVRFLSLFYLELPFFLFPFPISTLPSDSRRHHSPLLVHNILVYNFPFLIILASARRNLRASLRESSPTSPPLYIRVLVASSLSLHPVTIPLRFLGPSVPQPLPPSPSLPAPMPSPRDREFSSGLGPLPNSLQPNGGFTTSVTPPRRKSCKSQVRTIVPQSAVCPINVLSQRSPLF